MRPFYLIFFTVNLVLAGPALAQTCPPSPALPINGSPILHLSETASEIMVPTLLVVDLGATGQSRDTESAQRQVNELMARAKALVDKVPGVVGVFQDYDTSYIDAGNGAPAHWSASQTLELRGQSGDAVLGLVGQLQALGLTIQNLDWQVPAAQADAAARKARLAALAMLRDEAAAAASVLGLQVKTYQSIDLTGGAVAPGPMPYMASQAMAPPLATPDSQDITASVTAVVVLAPAITSNK